MATPDVQNSPSPTASESPATVDARTSPGGYMPTWWVFPAFGVAMLLGMLIAYLGVQYEQGVIALGGVVLYSLSLCAALVAGVRYVWLLTRAISEDRRAAKRAQKI